MSLNIRTVENYFNLKHKLFPNIYDLEENTKHREQWIQSDICKKERLLAKKQKIYRDKKIGKVYFVDFDNVVDCFSSVEDKYERLDTK